DSVFENITSLYAKTCPTTPLLCQGTVNTDLRSLRERTTALSSVMLFNSFDGNLQISGSNFSNVIGVLGSVLHIRNAIPASRIFRITDSKFEGNFATQGF